MEDTLIRMDVILVYVQVVLAELHVQFEILEQKTAVPLSSEANGGTYGPGCNSHGVEMKIKNADFNRTGALICGDDPQFISADGNNVKTFTADSDLAILQIYSKYNKFNLGLQYRYVDSSTSSTIPESCKPCKNKYNNCDDLVNACTTDPTMPVDCPITCGTCPGSGSTPTTQAPSSCVNRYSNCDDFIDDCTTDPTMPVDCPITCGTCPGSCENIYSNCDDFIDDCTTDPTMPVDCPITCGTCQG
uniref:ShKT domain-containing protein n=1 Tax=Acrobeloides nanus TaxID=290746 RepID=A0A914EA70_9BILA